MSKNCFIVYLLTLVFIGSYSKLYSQGTILNRGDLAIVGINANLATSGALNTKDEISFVCFKPITTGTEIQILDAGYENCLSGLWSGGQEGGAKFTRIGGTIPAGTVITFRNTSPYSFISPDNGWSVTDLYVHPTNTNYSLLADDFNINANGDQIYFAQGGTWSELSSMCTINGTRTSPNATFPGNNGRVLFGFSTSGSWTSFQQSSGESGLYPGMGCFSMAPTSNSAYNKYIGPLTAANQTTWISRISNPANWTSYSSTAAYNSASPNYSAGLTLTVNSGGDIPTAAWTPPSGVVCSNASAVNLSSLITGTTGGTWSGTGVSGATFNPTGLNGTYNITYSVNYSSGSSTCPITQTSSITVAAAPAAPAISITQPNCSMPTGTITISAPTGTGLTYSIDGITYTNTTGIFPGVSPNSYNVTVKNASGCISAATIATINASATTPAAPTVTTPVTYCQNATSTALTATGSNLLWYTNATGGTGASTAPTPNTTIAGTTSYYVSQSSGTCESPRSLIQVTVNTAPTINTVNNQSLCTGSSTTAINFSGTGLAVYNWTNNTPSIGLAASGTGNIASFTASNTGTSPVTATITATPVSIGYAYIANYGTYPLPAGNTVSVINTTTNTLVGNITVGNNPFGVAVSPDGTKVYVTNYGSNSVSVISTATNTVTGTISVGSQPQGIVLSPDGTKAYVTNQSIIGIGSVSVINTTTNTVTATITVGYQPQGVAISPDGSRLYVANVNSNNVSVINTTTNTVLQIIGVNTQPICVGINSDGSRLYIPNFGSNNVSVINTTSNTVIATVAVGTSPNGATVSPDGTKVYITNQVSNNFSVINTTTNTVTATVAVGTRPQGISFTSDGTKVYIANAGSNNVSLIDATTNTVTGTIAVGSSPFSLGNFVTPSSNCNGTPINFTITVNPKPVTPTASVTTQPSCSLPTGTITVSNPTGTGFSYSIDNVDYTNTSGVFSGLTPNTYSVTVKNASGCISAATSVTVNTVPSAPAAPTVTSPVNYCQNATATALTATGSNLLWYTAATGGTGSPTAPTPVTTTAGTISYYVSQTVNGCESPRVAISVTVNAATAAPAVTSTINYCQYASATALTATGSNLLWYTAATGGTGSSTAPTPVTTTAGTISYYVSQTINGCESPRAMINIVVNAAPAAPTVTTPVTYCQNATATALTATGSNLLWYTVATGGTGSTTTPIPNTAVSGTVYYYVSQTSGSCESPRAMITVTVNTIPSAPPTANSPVNYCQNSTAQALTASGSNLLWYTAATGGTGSTTAPTPATNTIGNTSYFVSQSNGTCESSRTEIIVTVNAAPSAPTVTSPVNYCTGDNANALTATGVNLLWYTSLGGTASSTAPTPSTATAGVFDFYVSQTQNSCESNTATITVNILAKPATPTITANGPLQICSGNNVILTSSASSGNQWYKDGSPVSGATSQSYTVTQAGSYTVEITNTNGCKAVSVPQVISFYANPVAIGIDKNVFEGDSVIMTNFVSGGSSYKFNWFPGLYLSSDTILNPWVVKPLSDMLYTLTVVNENGCSGTASVFVRLLKELIIPNAFSPNGDGVNDSWELINLNLYTNCSVDIFDRNGQVVYHSIGYQKPWDGKVNGKPAPTGVYYYIIDRKNNKPKYSGWVTLIR